jgi:hypothetical protein
MCLAGLSIVQTSLARDCNGNGVEDIDDITAGTSKDCNQNNIPDACEGWPIRLVAGEELPLGKTPVDLAAGDLDNDGDLDLLIGHRSGGSLVTSILNQGSRSFEVLGEKKVSGSLYAMALADLDGDGFLDVVAANNTAMVTLLNQGDGSMSRAISYGVPALTRFVHTADVNNDGAVDILSTNRTLNTISFWLNLNDGSGRFERPTSLTVNTANGPAANPIAITTADIDLDGDLDIVTSNEGTKNFSVLLNTSDGSFADPATYAHGGTDTHPFSLNVVDLDGDGSLDLATTTTRSLIFAFNNGDGTFGEAVTESTQQFSTSITLLANADLNRDGNPELVMWSTRPKELLVRSKDSTGGFGLTKEVDLSLSIVAMAAGDFDDDGWEDLAAVSSSPKAATVIWNGSGDNQSSFKIETEILDLEGCIEPRGCRPHGGTLIDIDGDGDLDGVGVVTHPGEMHIVDNEKGIMVARDRPYTFGRAGTSNGEHCQWVTVGDVDGDGDTDLATIDNHSNDVWIHINKGDGTLEPVGRDRRIRVGNSPQHVSLGDIDDDGDLDAIVSNMGAGSISLVIGNGDGTFESNDIVVRTGSSPRSTATADFDKDGATDIVVANSAGRSVTILRNEGGGTFNDRGVVIRLTGNPNGVAVADIDEDGDVDVIAAQGDRRNCAVLLNAGDGTFEDLEYYDVGEAGVYSVSVVDFDLDGSLDLITANETAGSVSIVPGNGDGTFGPPTSYSAGRGAGLRVALPGDIDGDGDIDIVTFNRGNFTSTVLYNRSPLDSPDFAESVCTTADFITLAAQTSGGGDEPQPFVKFTLPANDEAALQHASYQNSSRFPLHQDFLSTVFPENFPALDTTTYDTLVGRRDSRHYFVGSIRHIRTGAAPVYGFSVFARFGDSRERLSATEMKAIYDKLKESFHLEPLVYAPTSLEAVEVARDWQKNDPGFTTLIEGSTGGFEPYTLGVGYGRIRILSKAEFEAANANGSISFQDILILDHAPRDIEGVVNGIITTARQGELSHVAVRTARRGTPNAFLRTALGDFAGLDGKLVRLQVTEAGHTVTEVTEEQASAFWDANAGFLSRLPSLDGEHDALPQLKFIAALERNGIRDELPWEATFGGKATNLARLHSVLTDEWSRYQVDGFAIPMSYYMDFIRSNKMPSAFDAARQVTYEEYLAELFTDEKFASDSQFRFKTLADLREHMRNHGVVDEDLLAQLRERIPIVMGTSNETRVRFRSSSNAEDAIEFNGAGLYNSTQGCVADDLDGDSTGPSICDGTKNGERGLSRALRRVWSSLWNFRAYEERAFYGIPNDLPAMAVLVSTAFDKEQANGVVFTGNPTNRHDPRYVVTAQKGDSSVVSPDPGTVPEKNVLEMGENGEVVNIIRAVASSLVEPGEFVLSDDELKELGALMWHINSEFPVDPGVHNREDIILDLEFKKQESGDLAVKQVRPFLLVERGPAPPTFALEIPADNVLCGTFNAPNLSRTVIDEFELKAQLHLVSGFTDLPTAIDRFAGIIVEKFVLGPDRRVAMPSAPGTFTFDKLPGDSEGVLIYRFDYEQELAFPNGEKVEVKLSLLDFHTQDGVIVNQTVTLNEAYLLDQLSLQTSFQHRGETVTNFYGSCDLRPLQLWEINAELEDGTKIVLEERFRNEAFGDFQPGALVGATIEIAGQRRTISDYWSLIYKATRHNEHLEHMIVLDPPITAPGLEKPVFALQLIAPDEHDGAAAEAVYLDENLLEIAKIGVASYDRAESTRVVPAPLPSLGVTIQSIEVGGTVNNYATVSFQMNAADVSNYVVETSGDLNIWQTDAVSVSVIDHGDDISTATWRASTPIEPGDDETFFFRVRIKR